MLMDVEDGDLTITEYKMLGVIRECLEELVFAGATAVAIPPEALASLMGQRSQTEKKLPSSDAPAPAVKAGQYL